MMAERKSAKRLLTFLTVLPVYLTAGIADAAEKLGEEDTAMAEGSKSAGGAAEESVESLRQQVDALAGEIGQLRGAQDDTLLYVALGIGIVGILLAIIALVVALGKADKKAQKRVKETLQKQSARIDQQEAALSDLEKQLEQAEARIAQQGRQVEATRPAVQTAPMPRTAPDAPAVPSWETRARTFAAAYNQFLQTKVSGMGARNLKERFLQEHQIVGFSCVNYADRMSNPDIQPLFQINENQKEAHYWACPLGGNLYAVVPNSREYEMQKHTTVGYGKVFRSNYAGGVYHSITVIQPAIFRELVLQRPGQLRLGK